MPRLRQVPRAEAAPEVGHASVTPEFSPVHTGGHSVPVFAVRKGYEGSEMPYATSSLPAPSIATTGWST